MCSNAKLFFYSLDFSGIIPQFRILNDDSYKSIPSTIISIIIIISSISFSIYSIIDYMKFDNPSIFYLKRFDNISNKTLLLKDTLFMFRVQSLCLDPFLALEPYYQAKYKSNETINLNIEECKIGKNINIKFKDILEKGSYISNINDYLCISSEHENLPLSYKPGEDIIISITINMVNNEICTRGGFSIQLITENDIIMHEQKKIP